VRIRRIHLEEDAGKSIHDRFKGATAVDLNRCGVPLIEVVTEPDLRSPGEARAWLVEVKRVLEYLEVSDCSMEEGSLRVDANVLIRRAGTEGLGPKTELKNLNSFSAVERALDVELARQRGVVEAGGQVAAETLL
jgi:aspartyl-tRNA(Asn)/glutamyl-tRNA(Gln) amidotransferase subunit B